MGLATWRTLKGKLGQRDKTTSENQAKIIRQHQKNTSKLQQKMSDEGNPADKKGPPKFKQRAMRTFKSKAPKPGQKGFGDDIPGMEGLGTDITVVCPWEAFGDMELSDLAKYGIV
ncbi:retinal cone rhodopsin-sensitive cGMP 3',5'-cyclic phosphodiesterase subunit gamma isoform X1 [Pungitius pungitius]|uniref:retinal cone rhodopsin-sensitive cGMP 3',5'-cyclic phosphodiesterase subunit gamma isoform X1 n=2 Tax=Pungitius pungitius TaxID=134920 RepID=UPI00188713C3|nr:retinal cone rhodopsin-sensitive cGMP 3',5'-cyclic phosphodiesterase subunit gamma isoform X1 [Pungitius pungitius]